MSKYGIALATAGLSLIMASEASAAVVTYSFDGTVIGGSYYCGKDCYAAPELGSKVSGSISFDDAQVTTTVLAPGIAVAEGNQVVSYVFTSPKTTYSGQGVGLYAELMNTKAPGSVAPYDIFNVSAGGRLRLEYQGAYYPDRPAPLFAEGSVGFAQTLNAGSLGSGSYLDVSGSMYSFTISNASFVAALPLAPEPFAVPEPGTHNLLLAAAGVAALVARRQSRASRPNRSDR